MLRFRPALMKRSQALFACSLLGVACAISCGSDDDKTKVVASDAGAGGEGPAPEPGDGGKAGEPPIVVEGGAGGAPPVITSGGAGAGGVALGGAGGEPAACVGFEMRGVGGEGGAALEPTPRFTCEGVVGLYRASTRKMTFLTPPGLQAAVSGTFVTTYRYSVPGQDQDPVSACTVGTITGKGDTWELSAPFEGEPISEESPTFLIHAAKVQDACGAAVELYTPDDDFDGICNNLTFYPQSEDVWTVSCYEGYGEDCFTEQTCPVPTTR